MIKTIISGLTVPGIFSLFFRLGGVCCAIELTLQVVKMFLGCETNGWKIKAEALCMVIFSINSAAYNFAFSPKDIPYETAISLIIAGFVTVLAVIRGIIYYKTGIETEGK